MNDKMKFIRLNPYKLWINGKAVIPEGKETYDVINPVNNKKVASYYVAGEKETCVAIDAAREAFDNGPWGKMSNKERSDILLRAADLLEERIEEFVVCETLECGKLYGGCRWYDADKAVDALRYFAGMSRCLKGEMVPVNNDTVNMIKWYPQGVVAEIIPWNGPFMMGCQKIGAILAAGNTCIVKPSSWGSLTMLLFGELLSAAGLPDGVCNVITGKGKDVGNLLVQSEKVDMVAMTGGTTTGKQILRQSADSLKETALELGGKSPNIIFKDVNITEAAKWAKFAFTLNSGEVCVSGTRILVERDIYEEFLRELKIECEKAVPGDGFDKNTTLAPLIHKEHAKVVWDYIESGINEGARLVSGGVPYKDKTLLNGNFVPITVFADVDPNMKIFQEEIFGPVVCVTPFDTEEEAIKLANATKYGLAGSVFTKDIKRALRVADCIHSGQIYINSYFSQAMVEAQGTGWKQSGVGIAGIKKYMISKTLFIDLKDNNVPF